jgi:hypothetical protein
MAGYIGKAKSLAVLAEQDPSIPSQTGNSGKYLTTDGTDASWATVEALPDAIDVNASAPADSLAIDASGKVGIGTASPAYPVHLVVADSTDSLIVENATGAKTGILASSNDGRIGNLTNHGLVFEINGSGVGRFTTAADFKFNSGYGAVATAYGCRAWVNFDGTGTPSIRADGNVSSISDRGTGKYTVNFSTSLVDANYAPSLACRKDNNVDDANFDFTLGADGGNFSTSALDITIRRGSDGAVDTNRVCVAIFR